MIGVRETMDIGLVGVGRMGRVIAQRLAAAGHRVVAFDRDPAALEGVAGIAAAESLDALLAALPAPRAIWVMLPPGAPTQDALADLAGRLAPGDLVADGGNSRYTDSVAQAERYAARGLHFLDVGVSGGVWGLEHGYGVLVGGPDAAVQRLRPALAAIAAADGLAHVGGAGAGHFAKMVHNGVEYGVMEAYAEGFELLAAVDMDVDAGAALRVWARACSIRSFLLDKMVEAHDADPGFAGVRGWVDDSGMGRWTVADTIRYGVPAPVLTAALQARFRSRQDDSPAMRAIAATRQQVGGHAARTHA